ncbi:MAG: NapC/NirT family cytochrome c [Melioribacteraceae bacterium]|nr:NapC/NirT family cytochrome c [Melioribacteraceae bacterium]
MLKLLLTPFHFFFIFSLLLLNLNSIKAQNSECLDCHSDKELVTEKNGIEHSVYVDFQLFKSSVHEDIDCIDCHQDVDPDDLPHEESLLKVSCAECHDTEAFDVSVHGNGKVSCNECHGTHDIQFSDTLKTNFDNLCISCHKSTANYFKKSIHSVTTLDGNKKMGCTNCHTKSIHLLDSKKFAEEDLHSICQNCHQEEVEKYEGSLHGIALTHGKFLAPNCITCHNAHQIKTSKDTSSKTYKMNIPELCGSCHKDGTQISELKTISQIHILEDYVESIHGAGLFKRGLIVSAVCTDCHFTHEIKPHEDATSSINRKNIASTCTQCHAAIERVHQKVIKGELWEKEPHKIPACIDCHQPHQVRRVIYEQDFTNNFCMDCHNDKDIFKIENGEKKSLFVDINEHNNSAHKDNSCVKCHSNVSTRNNPICKDSGIVDCTSCHEEQVNDYVLSQHGKLHAKGDKKSAYCTDCHGTHNTLKKDNLNSPTFSRNIPSLCEKCHSYEEKVGGRAAEKAREGLAEKYEMSIHGKGLIESGLTVTATCADCHTAHSELPATDSLSSVFPDNIPATCAKCHLGIYEKFRKSIHSPEITKTEKELPQCADCHKSHSIERVDKTDFRQGIVDQCGKCHKSVTETYFDTFHGKATALGSVKTAHCYDCHGAHDILPTFNQDSRLSRTNIVETCKTCHPNSNKMFVGYLTHATHHDKDKYPYLYYTFWSMTILLISVFSFFGIHTILWFFRSLKDKKDIKKKH